MINDSQYMLLKEDRNIHVNTKIAVYVANNSEACNISEESVINSKQACYIWYEIAMNSLTPESLK